MRFRHRQQPEDRVRRHRRPGIRIGRSKCSFVDEALVGGTHSNDAGHSPATNRLLKSVINRIERVVACGSDF
jgi:hypothetical protein